MKVLVFHSAANKMVFLEVSLKGQCHEIFDFWFFSSISFPQAYEYFFLPDLFFIDKKSNGNFCNKLHNWYIIYKICRYLRQIEYKAKFSNQIHMGDSFRGCFISWALNTLYISLAKED